MRNLIDELKNLQAAGKLLSEEPLFKGDFTPLTQEHIAEIETLFHFRLPSLLKAVYTEVSNGGFGPSYGLMGLSGGMLNESGRDAVSLYLNFRESRPDDPYWNWPEKLLPLGHLGCGMYCCLDCSQEKMPVVWFEPNPHEDGQPWDDSYFDLIDSFEAWIFAYIDGEDLFQKFFDNYA